MHRGHDDKLALTAWVICHVAIRGGLASPGDSTGSGDVTGAAVSRCRLSPSILSRLTPAVFRFLAATCNGVKAFHDSQRHALQCPASVRRVTLLSVMKF